MIYRVLWGGVLISILVILMGLVAQTLSSGGFPRVPTALPLLPAETTRLTPSGLLSLGVLLMILTPIARVFLTILVFAEEHDRMYILVTGIVFLNLMVGVALGLLGVG